MNAKPLLLAASIVFALPAGAQDEAETPAPSPGQIVESAPADQWVSIAADDLLVMTLAPAADGSAREVVIQLMPAPFSQGWVENIRTLARAGWYDGISVNRVQDNYVVQWGDPGHDNPESGEIETRPLPDGLNEMSEEDYSVPRAAGGRTNRDLRRYSANLAKAISVHEDALEYDPVHNRYEITGAGRYRLDNYARRTGFSAGWPLAGDRESFWPIHCYGMVGVGRSYSPDTGSGAELYTVIGHAPRHLDRNIALVGRIISGMEHLSSLPRGSGALGFYTEEEADLRTPILSVRVASDIEQADQPAFEYLSTETESFARYAEARANRRDPFFIHPAGGADICNIPVPVRRAAGE